MDYLNDIALNLDPFYWLFGWTILNKSPFVKKVLVKMKGNESGQIKTIGAHTSVTMPDNKNCRFWDAETHVEIIPQRQVIVNKDGFFE